MPDADRAIDDAIAIGLRNKETIELARRHCRHMEFTPWAGGGRGIVEAETGLPIGMRRVRCPYETKSGGASGNLEWLASSFFNENCIGCEHRRPTGDVPNLSTVVEEGRDARGDAARESERRLKMRRATWEMRVESRRAFRSTSTPETASVIDDLGVLDRNPGAEADADADRAAVRRLSALAVHAPQAFTADVVDHAYELVDEVNLSKLLQPLRELLPNRPEIRQQMVRVALGVLRHRPDVDAANCLVELSDLVRGEDLDKEVIRSLVILAAQPESNRLGMYTSRSPEPAGLRVATGVFSEGVRDVLKGMLRPAPGRTDLVLPPGLRNQARDTSPSDFERCAAAGALCALATSHPDVVGEVADAAVRSLQDDEEDKYELHATADLQHTLAVLVVRGIVGPERLHEAGVGAGDEYRERLFGVLSRVRRLIDPRDRFREHGDPTVTDEDSARLHDMLIRECLSRVTVDWGLKVAFGAAELIERLSETDSQRMSGHVDALLGSVLTLVDRLERRPLPALDTINRTSPALAAMEEFSRKQSIHAAAHRLLSAIEGASAEDPTGVIGAVCLVLEDDRDNDRNVEVRWRLLLLLGQIARRHGHEPSVLRAVLPVLHTYIVDIDPALRSAALDAWVDIGVRHDLPSSLRDLLPALVQDPFVPVIKSLLGAARRLAWTSDDRQLLLRHSLTVASWAETADNTEILKDALLVIKRLGHQQTAEVAAALDRIVIGHAAVLDSYDLKEILNGRWQTPAAHSSSMAALRLRLARDPNINDRFNHRDYDEEMTALLDCGSGLTDLSTHDLKAAATDLAPDYPIAGAEFMEVLWRAGQPAEARIVMAAVLDAIPDQPAFAWQRAVSQCFIAAASVDEAAGREGDLRAAVDTCWDDLQQLPDSAAAETYSDLLKTQVIVRLAIRAVLGGLTCDAVTWIGLAKHPESAEPAALRRLQASQIDDLAQHLEDEAVTTTATGSYVRTYAETLRVAAQLLRYDAAELDGDVSGRDGFLTAAHRRSVQSMRDLPQALSVDDPLAAPLIRVLSSIENISSGDEVDPLLAELARLPLPLLVIRGPGRRQSVERPAERVRSDPAPSSAVGVVLGSIDDNVITGPQVVRPGTVHRLQLEVMVDEWPEWATRLDAELISHLSASEAETPSFTWNRPAEPDAVFEGEGTLILRFGLPAGQPAPPFLVALRFRGEQEGQPKSTPCDVTGHRELRLRPFDATRDGLTNYPVVDERLLELYEQLQGAGYDEEQLQAFSRLLTAVCRVGFTMTWEKRYKKGVRVLERDFHTDLHDRLVADPELGGRVERGSPSALGFLDVRHDGITAELKVERKTEVTRDTAPKYIGQPTQYAAADGARLSILCVLDMSPKKSPVGTPENYIFQLQPTLHGLTNPEAPSLVTVVIVNGNLPTPSSWSRRRVRQEPDGRS